MGNMGSVCALDTGLVLVYKRHFLWSWGALRPLMKAKDLVPASCPIGWWYVIVCKHECTHLSLAGLLVDRNRTQQHGKMVGTGKDALERGWAISTFQVSTLSLQQASYVCVRGTAGVCHPDRSGIAHWFSLTQAPKKFPEETSEN